MKTIEEKRAYQREWQRKYRANNKEKLKLYEHNRYVTKKRYQQRASRAAGAKNRCVFCEKLLDKEMRATKYCKNCRNDKKLAAYRIQVYRRREVQKRNGQVPDEVIWDVAQR